LPDTVPTPPAAATPVRDETRARDRISHADLHQRLLEEYAPPSVVVDEEHEVLHLSDGAARFMKVTGGEPSNNLLKMIRPELRLDLRTALYQARQSRARVDARGVRLSIDSSPTTVDITVRPILRDDDSARGFFLVLFETRVPDPSLAEPKTVVTASDSALQLEDEVSRLRTQLRATIEQYEIQAEEIKAANEELQAINEELRSTAEELETHKEELQSVNEELTTVNQELKVKIEEQSQANNDLQNLIVTSEIAALFLDRSLRIKLYTPRVRELFNLIPTDRGRPLADISGALDYDEVQADIARVLTRLERVEREVCTRTGQWHVMKVMPYRTADDRIDGVVLTFVDVTQRKLSEARVGESERRFRAIVSQSTAGIGYADRTGRVVFANDRLGQMLDWTPAELPGKTILELTHAGDAAENVERFERLIMHGVPFAMDKRLLRRNAEPLWVNVSVSPIRGADGAIESAVAVILDISERKRIEEALQQAHDLLESAVAARTAELRDLLNRLITVQEDERRRIARDLHDDIGQKMTALHLKLEALRRAHTPGTTVYEQAEEAQRFVQNLDRDLDFFTWELRPAALYDLGLHQALRDFVAEWTKNYGIAADFQEVGFYGDRLRADLEINLYRIAQEALNNVHKHARAANVEVVLQRRDAEVVLTIEDDGVGFDESSQGRDRGMGLVNMRERAALMGGAVEIERSESGGTTVIVRAPAVFRDH
jgi:two-component system CheB/CheR fusion protein